MISIARLIGGHLLLHGIAQQRIQEDRGGIGAVL
jgi:hypothetical protein